MANPHDNTENRSEGAPGQEAGQEESQLQSSSPGSISQPDPHQGLSEAIASGGNPPEIVTSRSPRTVDEDVAEELCGSSQDSSASSSNEPASPPSDRKLTTATLPPAQPEGAENIATESETEQEPSVSVAEPSSPKASQSEASISSREPPPLHPPQSPDEAGGECRYCLRKGRGRTLYSETALIAHERKQHPFPCLQGCVDRDFTTVSHRQQHYNSSIHTSSPTIARQYKCGRCGYTTDRRNFHIAHLGRQQACREMAQPAMYECIHHGPTSLDKEEHLSHLEDDRPSTGLFMCGRCGHTTEICYNHLRHLRRQHPCPQMKEPKMYECKTHGPTSLDMEEHITHLRDSSLHWIVVPSTEGEGKIVYNTTETER